MTAEAFPKNRYAKNIIGTKIARQTGNVKKFTIGLPSRNKLRRMPITVTSQSTIYSIDIDIQSF
jgi:hypothetical protein